ncbi:MAG TPA: malto-oligosyltrehalose trehalohydrolase [Opitutaceae bacterium]|nr:malto-oligosyltrehalose trehalohydrolase [Opitutaceae bacterium]
MIQRKLPVGAEAQPGGGVHFRVWAPRSPTVAVELLGEKNDAPRTVSLAAESGGYFSGLVEAARTGTRYKFKLERGSFPDPASRFQPDGPLAASQVVENTFAWTDAGWRGRRIEELVIYELHLGSFTREGTWRAASERLPELAQLGVTMIEVMPIADFAGNFGWGYDGVDLFAPTRLYGTPDDAWAFVDRAHALGLAVILDVVYNHLGPEGNFLREFSADYFTASHAGEWGDPVNFDGANAGPVREFFVSNARYWIEEFHFDGLRLDATQQIFDGSPTHILAEIATAARAAAGAREIFLVAENESQHSRLVRPRERGGYGLDALWNDDFHHAAHVAATGKAECYYIDYRGRAQEFISAAKYGFLYQGQWFSWQKQRRGRPAFDLAPRNFVAFLQNHDQVANSLRGLRLHQLTSPGRWRALTAALLLLPATPMLFQGQEFAASTPFLYFVDHAGDLRRRVAMGRRDFLRQFRAIDLPESLALLPDPGDPQTFVRTKLDWSERVRNDAAWRLHADLLRLRREDPTFAARGRIDGAVLADEAWVLRYFSEQGDDRLLIVNLGAELYFNPAPEPLLAPCDEHGWRILWSSESPTYGGGGTPPLETKANWIMPAQAAVLLAPAENGELPDARLAEKN